MVAATFGTDTLLMLRSRGVFKGAAHVPKFNKFHLYRPQLHSRYFAEFGIHTDYASSSSITFRYSAADYEKQAS
jgi:hypothetical protein